MSSDGCVSPHLSKGVTLTNLFITRTCVACNIVATSNRALDSLTKLRDRDSLAVAGVKLLDIVVVTVAELQFFLESQLSALGSVKTAAASRKVQRDSQSCMLEKVKGEQNCVQYLREAIIFGKCYGSGFFRMLFVACHYHVTCTGSPLRHRLNWLLARKRMRRMGK